MLAAVILAAGESHRMGRPKALLPYPGDAATPGKLTFLEHLVCVSRHPRIGVLRVVLGAHAETVKRRVALEPASIVFNREWAQGQLTSLQAALRSFAEPTDGAALFLVDHPLITPQLVDDLIRRFYESGAPIVLPTFSGTRGHPVIFAQRLYEELLCAPCDVGARAVVWAHAAEVLEVPTREEGVVLNLNDPEALRSVVRRRPRPV